MHTSCRTALRTLLLAAAGTALAGLSLVLPSSSSASTQKLDGARPAAAQPKLVFAPQTSGALAPPAIPPTGSAYLGAWVQPGGAGPYVGDTKVETELSDLGEFQAELGRPLGMVHVYQDWDQPASDSLLNALSSSGAVPIIDWSCLSGTNNDGTTSLVASGQFDTLITDFAKQLKAYGKPVFLRWLWEPNLNVGNLYKTCEQVGASVNPTVDGAEYVAAWRRIYNIFKVTVGATNVSFVWNPGVGGDISPAFMQAFWPGYHYVNWVGIDGYSRPTSQQKGCIPRNATFVEMFASTTCTNLYSTLSGPSFAGSGSPTLPMMIGETGAENNALGPNHQADYFVGATDGILSVFTNRFSDIKAVSYYDGNDPNAAEGGTWTLQPQPFSPGGSPPTGLAAFAHLAASTHFSFLDPG